jgi:hypothetical protein
MALETTVADEGELLGRRSFGATFRDKGEEEDPHAARISLIACEWGLTRRFSLSSIRTSL